MIEAIPPLAEPVLERPNLLPWVQLPSAWIEQGGLTNFRWEQGGGANTIAALMALAVIAHHTNQQTGNTRLTWTELCDCASLSRAKLGAGLDILCGMKLVDRAPEGRSTFHLANFGDGQGWAMLPARGLYGRAGSVTAFREFTLRLRAELDAMKIYFLLAARRDRATNTARLSYEKITAYSGVHQNNIRRALSLLASHNMVHISTMPSEENIFGIANVYRLAHLEPRRHPGTIGRMST